MQPGSTFSQGLASLSNCLQLAQPTLKVYFYITHFITTIHVTTQRGDVFITWGMGLNLFSLDIIHL